MNSPSATKNEILVVDKHNPMLQHSAISTNKEKTFRSRCRVIRFQTDGDSRSLSLFKCELSPRQMAYQFVREPLTNEDADKLANACQTSQDKLIIWPLLDCGLRVTELCGLTPKQIQWQQRAMRIKGKGGPYGKNSKTRVVPMSTRVRTVFEPFFALNDKFPVGTRQVQKTVKEIANRARVPVQVTPHVLRHTFATLFIQKGGSLAALKKILGHDRLSTTEIYLNLTDTHIVEEYHAKW